MYQTLLGLVKHGLQKQVPATGLALFRILFGLVVLSEVVFLLYFGHLVFDPVPFIEVSSPMLPFFLLLWGVAAVHLVLGRYTRAAAVLNYLCWVVFIVFTPMWQDFDGGFDQLMTATGLLLIFLPTERALSLDRLRLKLKHSTTAEHCDPPRHVSVLSYYLPLAISLGLLYFDSAVHKLYAEFWRNGMGAWLPSSLPYYMSGIDLTRLLNNQLLQRMIGYSILVFEFVFIFVLYFRRFRVPLLLFGIAFHLGIMVSLNIYPFGFGMLIHYALMVPFSWWRRLRATLALRQSRLTVFYDEHCPLCNRTVIIFQHFDLLRAIEFKGMQTHARRYIELRAISDQRLLQDLFALDRAGELYFGLDAYIQILLKMRSPAALGLLLKVPGIYQSASRTYRRVADTRLRLVCDPRCAIPLEQPAPEDPFSQWYQHQAGTLASRAHRISRFLIVILVLQLNATVHYGLLYRLGVASDSEFGNILKAFSDTTMVFSHVIFGITPHGLYMHDHFEGYDRIFAITYKGDDGDEKWLPFVNQQGRLIAPNWGRVQSMWANVAVTSQIAPERLGKFITKVTAFWGTKLGIDLSRAQFTIKMKYIDVPMDWEKDLRRRNLSGPWREVGVANWQQRKCQVTFSDRNWLVPR
ncbi:MAG: DCC1-like thiol-disulfide oxidoreductase family protein [Gammaproteobacteria bacterium]